MQVDLSGKRALVTGSSRGIGLAIARKLIDSGAETALNAREEPSLRQASESLGARAFVAGDVREPASALKVVSDAREALGGLDILVCNVGSGRSAAPGEETYADWQESFAVNLWSATNVIAAAREALIASKGSIACVSSICGQEVVPGAPLTYSAAKAALNAYVRGAARELGPKGVRINAVAPGNILFKGSVWERKLGENQQAVAQMLEKEVALSRLGKPEEIADLVAYLVSDGASFATGQIWTLDGGHTRA